MIYNIPYELDKYKKDTKSIIPIDNYFIRNYNINKKLPNYISDKYNTDDLNRTFKNN